MSLAELLIILVVALVVFGPDKLPMLAETLGRLVGKLQKLKEQWHHQLDMSVKQQQLEDNERRANAIEQQGLNKRESHE